MAAFTDVARADNSCAMDVSFDYDFDRFVTAQDAVYDDVLRALRAGRKPNSKSRNWMWYVFPQIAGLGASQDAMFYAISDREEAAAYLAHPTLGPRLAQCTALAIEHANNGAEALFGQPDDIKFQASMSLFSRIKSADPIFRHALDVFFGGVGDQDTLKILKLAFIATLDAD